MIRLAIFEDNDSLRNSLVNFLNAQPDFFVIGGFPNAQNVGQIVLDTRPHVVILDIEMPIVNGISAIPIIKEIDPEVMIIMYTQFEDEEKIYSSIRAGADGYILKNSPSKLLESIKEIMDGGVSLSSGVAKKVLEYFRRKGDSIQSKFSLTRRETEVLQFLVKGYEVKSIANELFISCDTTKTHLRNIYRKLHVNGGKGAIAKVLAEQISLS